MKNKLTSFILCLFLCASAIVLFGCNENIIDHKIFVSSSNIRYGTVSGEGVYKTDNNVVLTAVPNQDNAFICWIKNNIIISTEQTYSFTANSETEGKYIAVFQGDEMQHTQLTNLTLYYNSSNPDPDATYELTNVTLSEKINNISTEIFNQDKNETFSNQQVDYMTEIQVDIQTVYNKTKNYEFILFVTVKTGESSKTFTNNIIINFSQEQATGIQLSLSDNNIEMMVLFSFNDLTVSA